MIGTIVIPVDDPGLMLFLLPLFDRVLPSRLVHFLACTLRLRPGRRGRLPDRRGAAVRRHRQPVPRGAGRRPTRPSSGRSSWPPAPRRASRPKGRGSCCAATRSRTGCAVLEKKCLGCHVLGGKGDGRADRLRPQGLRLARLDPRPAREPQAAGLLRQGPTVRRHGRVEEELEAQGQASSTTSPTSSPRSPTIPRRHDARRSG